MNDAGKLPPKWGQIITTPQSTAGEIEPADVKATPAKPKLNVPPLNPQKATRLRKFLEGVDWAKPVVPEPAANSAAGLIKAAKTAGKPISAGRVLKIFENYQKERSLERYLIPEGPVTPDPISSEEGLDRIAKTELYQAIRDVNIRHFAELKKRGDEHLHSLQILRDGNERIGLGDFEGQMNEVFSSAMEATFENLPADLAARYKERLENPHTMASKFHARAERDKQAKETIQAEATAAGMSSGVDSMTTPEAGEVSAQTGALPQAQPSTPSEWALIQDHFKGGADNALTMNLDMAKRLPGLLRDYLADPQAPLPQGVSETDVEGLMRQPFVQEGFNLIQFHATVHFGVLGAGVLMLGLREDRNLLGRKPDMMKIGMEPDGKLHLHIDPETLIDVDSMDRTMETIREMVGAGKRHGCPALNAPDPKYANEVGYIRHYVGEASRLQLWPRSRDELTTWSADKPKDVVVDLVATPLEAAPTPA